jgi:dTDP-4-amino-4,6-dideoxygalactose transaminase
MAGIVGLVLPKEIDGRRHVWHQYTLRVTGGRARRDALQAYLKERGIESAVFYPSPIHRQPLYQQLGYEGASFPTSERLADEVLSIPVHPSLTARDLDLVASTVRAFIDGVS